MTLMRTAGKPALVRPLLFALGLAASVAPALAAEQTALAPKLKATPIADAIYSGGDILTMVDRDPSYADAIAIKGGKILALGARSSLQKYVGATTQQIDLAGKTLLPGFIDTHGHMILFGKNMLDADLVGTPDIPDLLTRMKLHVAKVPNGQWVVGMGYNARQL
jgi:predicted amidohydrolase YtcJ